MSSPSRIIRAALLALALTAPLAACTMAPVYSDRGVGMERVAVSYAAPGNRLEQIIYQDLALKLGKSSGAVPVVKISASQRGADLTEIGQGGGPLDQRQLTVTARVTVTDPERGVILNVSRSQTADFTTGPQAFANQEAVSAAARNAALLLADTLRLEILAALSK